MNTVSTSSLTSFSHMCSISLLNDTIRGALRISTSSKSNSSQEVHWPPTPNTLLLEVDHNVIDFGYSTRQVRSNARQKFRIVTRQADIVICTFFEAFLHIFGLSIDGCD